MAQKRNNIAVAICSVLGAAIISLGVVLYGAAEHSVDTLREDSARARAAIEKKVDTNTSDIKQLTTAIVVNQALLKMVLDAQGVPPYLVDRKIDEVANSTHDTTRSDSTYGPVP